MNKWDALRCKVADFNFQEELYKEEPKIYRDIESTIKENKKFHTLASFATMGVYRPQRAIFTPKEFARQRGSLSAHPPADPAVPLSWTCLSSFPSLGLPG